MKRVLRKRDVQGESSFAGNIQEAKDSIEMIALLLRHLC